MKIDCDCHMQCTYMMAKTQKNNGRWFYRSAVCYTAATLALPFSKMLNIYLDILNILKTVCLLMTNKTEL